MEVTDLSGTEDLDLLKGAPGIKVEDTRGLDRREARTCREGEVGHRTTRTEQGLKT